MAISTVSMEAGAFAFTGGAWFDETLRDWREKSWRVFSRGNWDDCKEKTNRWEGLVRSEVDDHKETPLDTSARGIQVLGKDLAVEN